MYAHHDLLEERTSLLARLGVKGSGDDSHFEAKARASIFFASVPEEPTENLDLLTSKLQARPKCAILDSSSDSAPDTSGELQPELFVVQEKQKHKIVKGQIDDWEPQLETELYMQKKDRRWKKKWIGYANTTLRKQETKHQKSGFFKTSQVVYCDQRRSRRCVLDPFLPNDKIIYIQTDRDKYMFQVYTHDKVHNFKCATKKECVRWYSTIREDLMRFYTSQEWTEKQALAKDLNRVLRAQFNFELLRYTQLLFRIANAGLFETHFFDEQGSATMAGVMEILIEKKRLKGLDESLDSDPSILQPSMKEAPPPLLGASDTVAGSTMESGILGSSGDDEHDDVHDDEQKVWKEFYFVMADAVLLLFKSSKAKEPSSVLALKYATVYVDEAALRAGQYIWCISSPMGRFYFRAKHDVVLSEWLYAADKEIRGRKKTKAASSSSILEKLCRIQTDLSTMRHVIECPEGRKTIHKYLRDVRDEEGQSELLLWKAIARVHSHTSTPEDRKRGRPVLAKLVRDPVRLQKLLTPATPPPVERKHKPSKSSKSEKETKELFDNPRDSYTDEQDSDFDEKDEESEPPPTSIHKVDDAVGWRYISHCLVQKLHTKHFTNFSKTTEYEALKKYLAHRWTPKREAGGERTSRRSSRHNSIHNSHNSSDMTLGTSPTQAPSFMSSGGSSTSSSSSGLSSEIGTTKLSKPTETLMTMSSGIDVKEKDYKEKDIKEKEPPDRTGLIEDDKDLEPFDPSTVQLSIEYLRKTGKDKEAVVKKIIKLPKNRDHIGIGRASSNSVRLPDPGVSRTHGRIEWKTKTLIYIDLGSAYGTKLNGESIKRAVLQVGDVLKMGKNSTIIVQSRVKSKSKLSMCRVM